MDFHLDPDQSAFQQQVNSFIEHDLPSGSNQERGSLTAQMDVERGVMKAARRPPLARAPVAEGVRRLRRHRHAADGLQRTDGLPPRPWHREHGRRLGRARCHALRHRRTEGRATSRASPTAPTSGAPSTPNPAPAPTSPPCRPAPCATATTTSSTARRSGRRFGHYADWGWLAARTDPDVPKHKGLSHVRGRDGVARHHRPAAHRTWPARTNSTKSSSKTCASRRQNLVGEENRGWYHVAIGLDFERSSIGATSTARRTVDDLAAELRPATSAVATDVRLRLAEQTIAVQVLRNMAYNIASIQEKTGTAPTREAQMAKLFGAELQQKIALTAVQILGMEGQAAKTGSRALRYHYGLLRSVANTIEGGTSEVQRSVIATRGLGLPRE